MSRNLRVALLTLVLVCGGLLAAVPAQAERFVHHDKSRDVQKVRLFASSGDGDLVPARNARQGDYVKLKVWHQVRAVRVVGKFRSLDRKGEAMAQIVSIRTPRGYFAYEVIAGPGMWKGVELDFQAIEGSDDPEDFESDDAACMTHRVNYARNRFSMRISRACLGRPEWVRVGAAFLTIDRRKFTIDDSMATGLKDFRSLLKMTPRLVHGDPR